MNDQSIVYKINENAAAPPKDAPLPMPLIGEEALDNTPVTAGMMHILIADLSQQWLDPLHATIGKLRSEIEQLKTTAAELRGQLAEAVAKTNATDFVVQRLRLDHKGDQGPQGLMGRDGAQGPPGPKGESVRGPRGQPGDRIVGWRLSPDEFLAYPITEQGKELPALNLMPFFTAYHEQSEASELDLEAAQSEERKAALQLEIARAQHGK
jgi:hypothetical protein